MSKPAKSQSRPRGRKNPRPAPGDIRIAPKDYQPNKAELKAETDMPRLSIKKAREVFFRPFNFIRG